MAIRLNDNITASGQISEDDIAAIKQQGFATVVTVRPDGEMAGQPSQEAVGAAAKAAGLAHHFLPVIPGTPPSVEDAQRFAQIVSEGAPVFAYCGAGPRVILLSSLAAAVSGRPIDDIIAEARDAGFDVSGARGLLEHMAAES
ncbi:MAG: TIGR01244 family sulfur transferase [Pseudomonadota bacterium]